MLDYIKQANGVEGLIIKRQLEHRSLHKAHALWRNLRGANDDAIDSHVLTETFVKHERAKPARTTANVEEPLTGLDETNTFLHTTLQGNRRSYRQGIG